MIMLCMYMHSEKQEYYYFFSLGVFQVIMIMTKNL